MADAEKTVMKALKTLLRGKKGAPKDLSLDSDLYDDLKLDSLESAELSVVLEDALGTDPYSEGEQPKTVREVVEFYEKS